MPYGYGGSDGGTDWSDPATYASTISSLGPALSSLSIGLNGLAQVGTNHGTVQTTQNIAGPVAANPESKLPTWYQRWADKLGAPVWALFSLIGFIGLLLAWGVVKLFSGKKEE